MNFCFRSLKELKVLPRGTEVAHQLNFWKAYQNFKFVRFVQVAKYTLIVLWLTLFYRQSERQNSERKTTLTFNQIPSQQC